MDWSVRQATPEMAPTVRDVARESWHAAYDDILGPVTVDEITDEWYAIGDLEESIREARNADDETFLVAVPSDGGDGLDPTDEIAGIGHAGALPDDSSVASLGRLYVRPDAWGEGAGTALLERIEATLEPTCDRLRLTVLADNAIGVSFYESAGFERVRSRQTELDGIEERVYDYEKAL